VNYFFYIILILYLIGCAVQGPISGGPIDNTPPSLVSIFPKNLSTELSSKQKIILTFDELIDPISVYESLSLRNQEYAVKVKGKKIIVSPIKEWNSKLLIEIYINRNLSDYQSNKLTDPINLFFSFGKEIPSNKIHGEIFDIKDVLDRYNLNGGDVLFDVGLYKITNSDTSLVKIVQSNSNLEFKFNAVDSGSFCIAAIEEKLIDITQDIHSRRYSISYDDIIFPSQSSDSIFVQLNIADPISKENISSVNFINQYYVSYALTSGESRLAVIDTIYNNFMKQNFIGQHFDVTLSMKNNFEEYQTDLFEFIVIDVVDTISPHIQSIEINDSDLELTFSEPLEKMLDQGLFYLLDSNNLHLDFPYTFKNKNLSLRNSININIEELVKVNSDSVLVLNVKKDIIKDLYGNTFSDSLIAVNLNNEAKKNETIGAGGVYGKVVYDYDPSKNIVVSIYNAKTYDNFLVLADRDNYFSFDVIPAGQYYLQAYENYNSNSEHPYVYFGGDWNRSYPSLKFSNILGPFEVRSNWDIKDMVINLD